MEGACRLVPSFCLGIAKHVECDAVTDLFPGTHTIDRFLHLAMPTITAFHGIGRRRKELIVEECERLVQVGAER